MYQKALKLAKEIEFNFGISDALIGLGNNYLNKGNTQKAQEYHELNIEFSEKINDQEGVASSYNNIGNIYNDLGNYTKSWNIIRWLPESTRNWVMKRPMPSHWPIFGLTHQKLENYPEAIDTLANATAPSKTSFRTRTSLCIEKPWIIYRI